jgi:hypothetical protein
LAPNEFQHQAHDHVLKGSERGRNAFAKICFYVLANPVRAELVANWREWRYAGAVVPGYPRLHPLEDDFWSKFWKLYCAAKDPDASEIIRPPLTGPSAQDARRGR